MSELIAQQEWTTIRVSDGEWAVGMGGSQRGRVLVRDDGRFKACTLGGGRTTWLSASAYVDLDPFPTFAAAFAAVREAVGKESP